MLEGPCDRGNPPAQRELLHGSDSWDRMGLQGIKRLELFPIRHKHLIDKGMRRNNEMERACRSHLIGIRSRRETISIPMFRKDECAVFVFRLG